MSCQTFKVLWLLGLVPAFNLAWGALSNEVSIPDGSRIAEMVGTYSPVHLRHNEHFETILKSDQADFVLVIPNDLTLHKPFAISTEIRLEMLQAAYAHHPRIIVPHTVEDIGFPITKNTRRLLDQSTSNLQWIGVVGKDSALSFWAKLGAHFQSMEHWLVLTPDSGDEDMIPGTLGRKNTIRVHSPTENDIRSTVLRAAARSGDMAALHKLVFPEVAEVMLKYNLYQNEDPSPQFGDYLRSCRLAFKKLLESGT